MPQITAISEEHLQQLKQKQIFAFSGDPSYSEIWETPNNTILKIYTGQKGVLCDENENIYHDIATLGHLLECSDVFDERFATPIDVLTMGNEVIGYTMPLMEGEPLSKVLRSMQPREIKPVFCQLYRDIIFVHERTPLSICDLHEDNIILDQKHRVAHIDLDGWYNGDGFGRRVRYLSYQQDQLASLPSKYVRDSREHWITDLNSDIFCLIQVILNYLMQSDIPFSQLPFNEANEYIDYVRQGGVPDSFLAMYKCLYTEQDNYFDEDAVMCLPEMVNKCSYQSFKQSISKFHTEQDALAYLENDRTRVNHLLRQIGLPIFGGD